eukprot:scaffold5219_cov289-Prasinococcus_capsulatus_cf.AAC.4
MLQREPGGAVELTARGFGLLGVRVAANGNAAGRVAPRPRGRDVRRAGDVPAQRPLARRRAGRRALAAVLPLVVVVIVVVVVASASCFAVQAPATERGGGCGRRPRDRGAERCAHVGRLPRRPQRLRRHLDGGAAALRQQLLRQPAAPHLGAQPLAELALVGARADSERARSCRRWTGPLQYEDRESGRLMMLPSDLALLDDPKFRGGGAVAGCASRAKVERLGRACVCGRYFVELYAADEQAFFRDFAAAFSKLLALGCPRECQPANSACPFAKRARL